uniref:Mediator of RNA polymerase II transcription subunit 33A n=1 Tax=Rhizophora mucronata TaxID=61149 RepID=A0A2P2LNA1_RHIMU
MVMLMRRHLLLPFFAGHLLFMVRLREHTILFIIGLMLPLVPTNYSGRESHLLNHAPLINVLLTGISSVDCVQIISLHGLVPLLAGALFPICEVFGSSIPNVSWTLPTGEEISCHDVFSNAFTLLLRLWRFDHPPLEHVMVDVPPVGSHFSPEYLLLVRNFQLLSFGLSPRDRLKIKRFSKFLNIAVEPMFLDSFPKLKRWYRQHVECIVSTFSGLAHGTTVHQIVNALLNMMFRRINRGIPTSSGSSNSSSIGCEDAYIGLKVPAWDILEATPFALDAALTACAHGSLSPRDLATGLKDLADFLPASLATIVSYFSAEVTRGIWKPAFMNGTDWPSPAANLSSVEQQIKKILAATGVDVPSLAVGGNSPATLPLPLAVLVSLTITYKLDKASERCLTLVGPALNSLAVSCPWPSMPILASLWAQKVRRWNDFIVFSASQTVFHHNNDAVVQLLRSCFTSTLGCSPHASSTGGVGALLGHGFGSHFLGGISPVAPGILYLRVHRSVRDVMFVTEVVLSLLMTSVRDIANSGFPRETVEKLKKTKYSKRYGEASLASAMTRVKLAASLGASLVWISGGLNLIQSLIKEILPSWFISAHGSEQEGTEPGGMLGMLRGYALAYFAMLCGTFAWGVESTSGVASKRRPKILRAHLEFLASALDGKISLGCDWATARAYVLGFISLMVACSPAWVAEVDVDVLKRLAKGLRQLNEEELALALLGHGGVSAMSTAAELILETGS